MLTKHTTFIIAHASEKIYIFCEKDFLFSVKKIFCLQMEPKKCISQEVNERPKYDIKMLPFAD